MRGRSIRYGVTLVETEDIQSQISNGLWRLRTQQNRANKQPLTQKQKQQEHFILSHKDECACRWGPRRKSRKVATLPHHNTPPANAAKLIKSKKSHYPIASKQQKPRTGPCLPQTALCSDFFPTGAHATTEFHKKLGVSLVKGRLGSDLDDIDGVVVQRTLQRLSSPVCQAHRGQHLSKHQHNFGKSHQRETFFFSFFFPLTPPLPPPYFSMKDR